MFYGSTPMKGGKNWLLYQHALYNLLYRPYILYPKTFKFLRITTQKPVFKIEILKKTTLKFFSPFIISAISFIIYFKIRKEV